jgi:hypothetical protein
MTKRARDPKMTMRPDEATGIVGIVPRYDSLKNTHRDKVQTFFGGVRTQATSPGSRPINPGDN